MACEEHLARLKEALAPKSNPKLWNEWRRENPKIGIDLGRCDLAGANLRGINFIDVNLAEANLSHVNFTEAYLRGANLSRANLSEADLTKSFISKAHLNLANLTLANLSYADLTSANLRESNLTDANFSKCYLSGADLRRAVARRANFTGAYLGNADLSEASFLEANWNEVNLTGAIVAGIQGPLKSASRLVCSYLEFHKDRGKQVLEWKGDKDLGELTEYLTNPNKLISHLYLLRSRKERHPLLRVAELVSEREAYKILEKIGSGPTAVVYKAIRVRDRQPVAIKIFEPDALVFDTNATPGLRRRFILESARTQRLQHPCVIEVQDRGASTLRPILIGNQEKTRPFFVMEYIDDKNLYHFVKNTPFSLPLFLSLMKKIAQTLLHIHTQPGITEQEFQESTVRIEISLIHGRLMHKNLKPQNIFVAQDGARVKLADLGFVHWQDISNSCKGGGFLDPSRSESILSTLMYLAPEIKEGQAFSLASDIFSLGLTFYFMLEGKTFDRSQALNQDKSQAWMQQGIPAPLRNLLSRMIQMAPDKRPLIQEVVEVLENCKKE